jgi:hypothetical protein
LIIYSLYGLKTILKKEIVMPTVSLTGKDVVKINGRILNDFGDGDCAHITYPNDLATIKSGKNGNSIIAFKNDGRQAELSLRVLRGSGDDKFLNNIVALFKNDPSAFVLISGEMTKNVGDGAGGITADTYILGAGVPRKQPEVVDNADGTTDQALAVYGFAFCNAPRSMA